MKDPDQKYRELKFQSDGPEDLVGRLLFRLISLQNSGNAQINALSQGEVQRHQIDVRFGQSSELQRKAITNVLLEIKNAILEKDVDFSEVIQVLTHIASSNSALYEVFEQVSGEYPQVRKQLAEIGEILRQNKPKDIVLDGIIKAQEKGAGMLGKLIVALTEEVKRKNFPEDVKISGPVEISKPKWWKEFSFSWEPLKELFEKLKSHTFSVKVENQSEADFSFLKNLPEDVANMLSKVLAENLPKIRISGGGGGNPFTFLPGGALKVYNDGPREGGTEGGALETTLQSVLAQLQTINTNTDGLELKADQVNLNTDTLEQLLTDIKTLIDGLEGNTTGLATETTLMAIAGYVDSIETLLGQRATETTLAQVRDYLDQVETKLDTLITQTDTLETAIAAIQPRDISKAITAMTISLNASGNVKVPASGKKLRIHSVQFSLSADMTDISFRFASDGTDFAKFLVPKAGGYYGLNMNHRYFDGNTDQALYCVITGAGTVQINVNYVEI